MSFLAGQESPPFVHEAARWLGERLRSAVEHTPGGHGAPFDHASEVAAHIVAFAGGQPR